MSVAEEFQLLGHGNGWPSRGSISGSSSLNMGQALSVRPYVAASASNGYNATGFERFITLGGYSDSNSGSPTQEQLNLSLANAMKIFYNIESSCSGNASASATPDDSRDKVSATSNLSNANYINGARADLGAKLTPRERVMLSIRNEYEGLDSTAINSLLTEVDVDSDNIPEAPIGADTQVSFRREIVRMFDTTDTNNQMFLGYGINTPTIFNGDARSGASLENDSASCTAGVGSYINPPVPDSQPEIIDRKFSAINSTMDDMPIIAYSVATSFIGHEPDNHSASASGSSASATSGACRASASVSGDSSFYTY
mgnify:CR=1 FL=1